MDSRPRNNGHFLALMPAFMILGCLLTTRAMLGTGSCAAAERPNILWITSEDNGISWVSCYGGTNASTPAIDQLAREGFRYTHCFDNAAVCAPTRSCWITGMYGISNGTQPMRSRNAIPHDKISYYPDLLKKAGYHTSNPGKTDYNIGGRDDKDCWDFKGGRGKSQYGWRHREPGQPFFAVVNIGDSHESRAHGDVDNPPIDPAKMKLFSYHPDLPVIRKNYAKYAAAVENMDRKVKDTLDALKKDGLYDDTIIKNYMPYAPAGHHLAYLWKAPATPAWEQHHREGKTNEITGRFFRPRVSEEFYDNETDFDNVHNLINNPEHQQKITELKKALRRRQLELFDSGLLPEKMRERRAAANNMTIYEMVRDKNLYPLETYLDAADLALLRDKANLETFVKRMSDEDEGMCWWAVVGLHLLEKDAASTIEVLEQSLGDQSQEVRMMAAWTLVKLGESEAAIACLDELLFQDESKASNTAMLHNVLDWMGEPALPSVKKYIDNGGTRQGRYGIGILGRIAQLNGW